MHGVPTKGYSFYTGSFVLYRMVAEGMAVKDPTWRGKERSAAMGANYATVMTSGAFQEAGKSKKFAKTLRAIQVRE